MLLITHFVLPSRGLRCGGCVAGLVNQPPFTLYLAGILIQPKAKYSHPSREFLQQFFSQLANFAG
ncbi:MAG: hypothetical protein ACK493_02440 [Planctomycetota bacterium]|jgi:hypothetical protein